MFIASEVLNSYPTIFFPLIPNVDIDFQEYEQRIGNYAECCYGNDATDTEYQATKHPNQKEARNELR